jgi:hypothetical protein
MTQGAFGCPSEHFFSMGVELPQGSFPFFGKGLISIAEHEN